MAAEDTDKSTLKEVGEPQTEKTLFSWNGQTRPFKKQSREVYVTIASMALLLGVILIAIDGLMPALLIVAFLFLFYVLNNVEPEKAEFRITSYGIRVANSLTPWENLGRFWFSDKMGSRILVLEKAGIIGRMELVIDSKDEAEISKVLKKYMLHEEATPTFLDKSANWVAGKIQQ